MQDQRKQRIRAVGQLVLLASGLACGPCLSAAEVGRGPARVYVVDFEQSGNSPAFPDLNRFLTSFLRLHLTSIPSIAISGPNEPSPCDAKPGLSLQHSDSESQSVSSRASFYTVRGSLELHNPQGGGNAEVLASYQLTKASGCTQGEVVLLAQSDKFSLAEALEHFGSIADLLATKLKGELARRIPIDIYRIGESGAAPNELGTGQLLTRYLMIRVSQVDDLKPQLAEASDAGAPYSVKGQVTFSRQPDGRRTAMAKLRIISKDGGKEYVLDPAPEGMIRTDVRDDLGDFALQAADATVDWLNRVRFAREAGIEAVPVAALLIKAGELLCSNQGSGSCSPQPESALVALNRIAPE